MPTVGYKSFNKTKSAVINYIAGYYSSVRSHRYNGGLTPNESEALLACTSLSATLGSARDYHYLRAR